MVVEFNIEVLAMPMWANQDRAAYHGCDDTSAQQIVANGIVLGLSNAMADFGHGFYTTTNIHQAHSGPTGVIRYADVTARPALRSSSSRSTGTPWRGWSI